MLNLKHYPFSSLIVVAILYLSFFTPPQTELDTIPYIDKLVHICMYGGLGTVIWLEYLWHHTHLNFRRLLVFGILLPIVMSGIIEILQSALTDNRGGDWFDLCANTIGITLAALMGYFVWQPLVKRIKK